MQELYRADSITQNDNGTTKAFVMGILDRDNYFTGEVAHNKDGSERFDHKRYYKKINTCALALCDLVARTDARTIAEFVKIHDEQATKLVDFLASALEPRTEC